MTDPERPKPKSKSQLRRLTLPTRIAIHEYIKPLLAKQDDGYWAYAEPHSDASVAALFNDPTAGLNPTKEIVSDTSVAQVRKTMIGHLRPARFVPPTSSLSRTEVDTLLLHIEALAQRLERLERELGITP